MVEEEYVLIEKSAGRNQAKNNKGEIQVHETRKLPIL